MPTHPATQADILLAAINARYRHTSFGLRYLLANLGPLEDRALIYETTLQPSALEIADEIVVHEPKILGLGVYVWNAVRALEVVRLLKERRPGLIIVLGGPEVSHEWDVQAIVELADYVVCGEGEHAFRELCRTLLKGKRPAEKIIQGGALGFDTLKLPYTHYTEDDIAHRVVYVEASRGCPYRCQFCLSALDRGVRMVPHDRFFGEMDLLLERGALNFKFIDRTFNLRIDESAAILHFFLERLRPGLSLHFEMVPDRLPTELRELLAGFPPATVQLEVGIQTFNAEVGARIERRQDLERLEDNLRFLSEDTHAHIHADLIVGLPGENVASFGRGFDRLHELGSQEIQVGILKRLRGTPIVMHEGPFEMRFNPQAPYEVLATGDVSEREMDEMKRFARFWDLVVNNGNFIETSAMIRQGRDSPFDAFRDFSQWIFDVLQRTHHIGLYELSQRLFDYLTERRTHDRQVVAKAMARDIHRTPGRKTPRYLKPHLPASVRPIDPTPIQGGLARQSRHGANP